MLKTPARNATATARPVRMSGVARTSVPDPNAYHEPNAPARSARNASPIMSAREASSAVTHQAANHRDTEHWTEGEQRKEPLPPDEVDDGIHEQRADRCQQKAGGRLNGQRRSNGVWRD